MSSGTPGGNWKGAGGSKPPASSGSSGKSRRPWQPGDASKKPVGGKKKSRLGRFIFAGIAVGVLVALIVYVSGLLVPPKYPTLIVVAPNASKSLASPEYASGARSAGALADLVKQRHADKRLVLGAEPHETADKDAWRGVLDKQKNAHAVVLYFAAAGGADSKGAFLWFVPAEATSPSDEHKLYVKDILTPLKSMPKDKPKLVVFDVVWMSASWPHGSLTNDFARALVVLDKEIDDIDGLAVINSSKDDERAWASDRLKSSVFGHFFREGLRGAAAPDSPGTVLNARQLFDYVADKVTNWADGSHDEKQTPILLPASSGRSRAEALTLTLVPTDGYKATDPETSSWTTPDDLKQAWSVAQELAARKYGPSPDTWNPAGWRRYLDLLLHWERLVRQGENPDPFRSEARLLGPKLVEMSSTAEPVVGMAIPAGQALGIKPAEKVPPEEFKKLWTPPKEKDRARIWAGLSGDQNMLGLRRVAVSEQVVDYVVATQPSSIASSGGMSVTVLQVADEVFQDIGAEPGTAEGHFLRMLNRHLDPKRRPDDALLVKAILLRRQAERAAWVGGAKPDRYPHSEQVFRWIKERIKAGDDARRPGEDLLFGIDPTQWKKAGESFDTAKGHYDDAEKDARKVADALNARDRVLARLPYYARWFAANRSDNTGEITRLVERAEAAAKQAHEISRIAAAPPATEAELRSRIDDLDRLGQAATKDFGEIETAFDKEVNSLTGTELQANWYALDNALSVPFILADKRSDLLGYLRKVGNALEGPNRPSPQGAKSSALPAAQRHGRLAAAVLGEPVPDLKGWTEVRLAGEELGKHYQRLAAEVQANLSAAGATAGQFREAAKSYHEATRRVRLIDPAAATPTATDPIEAERRLWQHEFLTWQARRTLADGWASVKTTPDAPDWYCKDSAKLAIDAAKKRTGAAENAPENGSIPRLRDVEELRKYDPLQLALSGPLPKAICDDPSWTYAFTVARLPQGRERIGFPVSWVKPPTKEYGTADPNQLERHIVVGLDQKDAVERGPVRFSNPAAPEKKVGCEEIVGNALYRGHRYETITGLRSGGTPVRDIAYDPPQGAAAFCVIADPSEVAGALTILIDLSGSMTWDNAGNKDVPFEKSRLAETIATVVPIIQKLPAGTILTVAVFWGEGNATKVGPVPGLQLVTITGNQQQRDELVAAVRKIKVPNTEANTPIARSITRVVSKSEGDQYWPDLKRVSGVRTLIVLTDGADNHDNQNAGLVVRKALLEDRSQPDTSLHMLFFALSADDGSDVDKQFEILKEKLPFIQEGRTPPVVSAESKSAGALTAKINAAIRPRVQYNNNQLAAANRKGELFFTLRGDNTKVVSPPLDPGTYEFLNLANPQSLRLLPGDRIVLQTRRRPDAGLQVDLVAPPYVYDTLGAGGARGDNKNVRMTVPSAAVENKINWWKLSAVATLERPIPDKGSDATLLRRRPLMTWFDPVDDAGQIRPMPIAIRNRPHLAAPAWDIDCPEWLPANKALKDGVPRPKFAGYWVDNPNPTTTVDLHLRNPALALNKDNAVKNVEARAVRIVSLDREKGKGDGLAKDRDYLVVRLEYDHPEKPVFVRPNGFKPDNNQFQLVQRHRYYDLDPVQPGGPRVGRYTAYFGPIDDADQDVPVKLEIYSVTDLKKEAEANAQNAVVDFGAKREWSTVGTALSEFELKPAATG